MHPQQRYVTYLADPMSSSVVQSLSSRQRDGVPVHTIHWLVQALGTCFHGDVNTVHIISGLLTFVF